jgi:hypothetical protein
LFTQCDRAASGEPKRRKKRDPSSACMIVVQSSGVAERLVSSRNTRNARRLYHGFASDWRPRWIAGASRPSAAWLYEMNASYRCV